MTPELALHIINAYPLTTPLVHFSGFLAVDNFGQRVLNAWPDIRQVVDLFR